MDSAELSNHAKQQVERGKALSLQFEGNDVFRVWMSNKKSMEDTNSTPDLLDLERADRQIL